MTLTLPTPVLPDPDAVPALRWGVIGTGIAGKFVTAIHRHTPQRAIAVTARDAAKTSAFAAEHGIDRTVSSVEALVTDPEVDVVYVATPHPLHREQALAAIAAGKHVLIEKPIAMSAAEAQEITGAGRPPACSSWRRCGRGTCRSRTSCGDCSPTARSAPSGS